MVVLSQASKPAVTLRGDNAVSAKKMSNVELKLLMLNPYIDSKKLHMYKITGSDAVFITKVGNVPFAEEIKNHINGEIIDSKFHICKTNLLDSYFITEIDNCGIPPEPFDYMNEVRPRYGKRDFKYTVIRKE